MNVVIAEVGPALFSATVGGTELCRSRTPLLSAARILLKAGADPDEELTMSRADGVVAMRTTVGVAADLAVREPSDGSGSPRFVPYRPLQPGIPFKDAP